MKRLIVATALLLTACGGGETVSQDGEIEVKRIDVQDREVICIIYNEWFGYGGGISCDWTAR